MGLDKELGETLPGIGRGVPASVEKWACIPELFQAALAGAYAAFDEAGAPAGYELGPDNLLVQEHHLLGMVVFIFWMPIAGADAYYTYSYDLPPELTSELALVGKWPALYAGLPGMKAH